MRFTCCLPVLMLLGLASAVDAQPGNWDATGVSGQVAPPLPLGQSRPESGHYGQIEGRYQPANAVQKVYAVADLVVPVQIGDQSVDANAQHLMKLAQMTCPTSWAACGGCGQIDYYPLGHALVVRQTPEVQEKVAELLASLRKLQDTQVVLEIRFVRASQPLCEAMGANLPACNQPRVVRHVNSDGVERIGIDFNQPTHEKTVIWNNKQVHQFLEAVQGDRRSNVMQAPRLTVLNGQNAQISVGETQHFVTGMKVEECKGRKLYIPVNEPIFLGTRCEVVAVAKDNCKDVLLRFKACVSEPVGKTEMRPVTTMVEPVPPCGPTAMPIPFTQYIQKPKIQTLTVDRTATVPCDCTLVLPVGTFMREERTEHAVPVLSNIPYVNRLFRNVGYGMVSDDVVVLVTPRLLVQPEQAAACVGSATAPAPACVQDVQCAIPCPELKRQFTVVKLRNSSAVDVVQALNGFFSGSLSATRLKPCDTQEHTQKVVLTAEPVSNAVLVCAVDEWYPTVLRIIERLDMPPARKSMLEVRATKSGGCNTLCGGVGSVCSDPCPMPAARYYPGGFQSIRGMPWRGAGQEFRCPVMANERPFCVGFVDSGTVATPACCQVKTPTMNMADVVALSSSGVSEEIICNQIRITGAKFTLATEDILWLKKNKVNDNVVMAMQRTMPLPVILPTPPIPPPVMMPAAPAFAPQPYAPVQYYTLPTPVMPTPPAPMPPSTIPYLKPVKPMPSRSLAPGQPSSYLPAATNSANGPMPLSFDFGFPCRSPEGCTDASPVRVQQTRTGSFIGGGGVNSDAGITGSIIINERNFDVKPSKNSQATEVGEQLLNVAAELVGGVATFVGEELPALMSDAAETVRPKVKVRLELKFDRDK